MGKSDGTSGPVVTSARAAPGFGWRHTIGLVGALSVRSFRVRYKRARLGVLWALLQPGLQAAVFALLFLKLIKIDVPDDYVAFLLAGVLPWSLFSQCVAGATNSIVDSGDIVRKLATPRAIFPIAAIGGTALSLSPILVLLVGVSVATGRAAPGLVLLVPGFALTLALALGIGLVTASLYVEFRDVRPAVESALFVAFYLTPVVYDAARLDPGLQAALRWNPMSGVLSLYRAAVLASPVDLAAVAITTGATVILLVAGTALFTRRSGEFADLL